MLSMKGCYDSVRISQRALKALKDGWLICTCMPPRCQHVTFNGCDVMTNHWVMIQAQLMLFVATKKQSLEQNLGAHDINMCVCRW